LATFLAGSVPFALALMAFVVDLTFDANLPSGAARLPALAAALTIAYAFMKAAHASYARQLFALAAGIDEEPPAGSSRGDRLGRQLRWQSWSLWALPAAAVVTLPYAWVHAFFQGLAITSDPARARRFAAFAPLQNHAALSLLAVVTFVVAVNTWVTIVLVPFMMRAFLGWETEATFSASTMLNSTVIAASFVLTYLTVAPLTRAVAVLRLLEAESRSNGEDLLVELRELRSVQAVDSTVRGVLALLLGVGLALGAAFIAPPAVRATTESTPAELAPPAQVAGSEPAPAAEVELLTRELDRELAEPAYAWRRNAEFSNADLEASPLAPVWEAIARFGRAMGEGFERLMDWLDDLLGADDPPSPTALAGLGTPLAPRTVVLVLAAVALAAGAGLAWRARRRRSRRGSVPAVAVPTPAAVDLDSTAAARRPSDEWLELAAEFERQGDLRRAVRAVHLASLSRLAAATLLELDPAKTNRGYGRELGRRAGHLHEAARLTSAFSGSVRGVEPVWFGEHAATVEGLETMRRQDESLAEALAAGPRGVETPRGGRGDVAA
jgi:hypothetical protein